MSQTWNLRYFTVICTGKNKEILLCKVLINSLIRKLVKKLNLLTSFTILLVFRDHHESKHKRIHDPESTPV